MLESSAGGQVALALRPEQGQPQLPHGELGPGNNMLTPHNNDDTANVIIIITIPIPISASI